MSVAIDRTIPTVVLNHVGYSIAFSVLLAVALFPVTRAIMWYAVRKAQTRLKEREAHHMDFHATYGDHLIVVVTGEDAEEQWPEIKRRLWEWKRAQNENGGTNDGGHA